MSDDRNPRTEERILLERLDERMQQFMLRMDDRLKGIESEVSEVRGGMKSFVTVDKFKPTQMIVYGMVSIILTGFVGGLIALLIKLPK